MTKGQAISESFEAYSAGTLTVSQREGDVGRRLVGDKATAETRREQVLSSMLLVTL